MTALRDTAKAKLNLTLEVLGRRDDRYHEIRSLVAFAALGDGLELEPGQDLALAVDGPFAAALSGDNLVIAAAEAARSKARAITLGRFRLTKNSACCCRSRGRLGRCSFCLAAARQSQSRHARRGELAGDCRGPWLRRSRLPAEPSGAHHRPRRGGHSGARISALCGGARQSRPSARSGGRLRRAGVVRPARPSRATAGDLGLRGELRAAPRPCRAARQRP